MTTESKEITALKFAEQELEPPPEQEESFAQAQRLLARLLVRAWLVDHKHIDKQPGL